MKVKDLRELLSTLDSKYDDAEIIVDISNESVEILKKDDSQRCMYLDTDPFIYVYYKETNKLYISELTSFEKGAGYTEQDLCPNDDGVLVFILNTFGVCSGLELEEL